MPVIDMSMTGTTLRRGCLGARSLIEILKASRVSARSLARSKRCELAGWASARGTQTLSPERSKKKIRARSAASEYFTAFVERVGLADCNWLNAVHCVPVSSATVLTSQELLSTPPHPDLPETLAMSRVRPVRVRPRPSKRPSRVHLEDKDGIQNQAVQSITWPRGNPPKFPPTHR